jgi:hypothetical protein
MVFGGEERVLVCLACQVWTERLREWMASQVLKPLVAAMAGAHSDVMTAAGAMGWAGVQLQPLGHAPDAARGAAASAEADDEVLIAQMREQLVGRLRVQPQQQPAEAWACLEVGPPKRHPVGDTALVCAGLTTATCVTGLHGMHSPSHSCTLWQSTLPPLHFTSGPQPSGDAIAWNLSSTCLDVLCF